MLWGERRTVHRVCEEHLVAHRVLERQAALVVLLDAALDPVVGAAEHELDGLVPIPASSRIGHSGVPVHSAVPIASVSHGCEIGRGDRRARPLPAHSIVTGIVMLGRFRRSVIESSSGCRTSPPTESVQVASSASGTSKWISR